MHLSVVVPVYNEEDNIVPMIEALKEALKDVEHEVIFVDDGSHDDTCKIINETATKNVRLVQFQRNFGQTSAMAAGIDAAKGELIATLDGDLQNDPSDIPMMIEKLEKEGLDIVAGIRANRQDGRFLRKIPSKIANMLIRAFTKVDITDYGCTLKVFRTSIAKQIELYGELHRFIPVLGHMEGAKIAEVEIKHHARKFGESKYGIGRTFRVVSDLLLMIFLSKWRQKPMHLFGTLGVFMLIGGGLIETYLLFIKVLGGDIGGRPLFYVGILLIITGVQLITTGFISELLMRTYYESQNKKPYNIRDTYTAGKSDSKTTSTAKKKKAA
ncbi:MAG: glycosyltransferase [Alphaproteobacteria bacterium CG11_big_fil_rev_8_21_14_0_20_39_49]|nr:MAG: glycosyltransferase [Alphaproteobacteria bacterium CG11_big_fil_rev_8_21_14_0_20_39_49]